MSYYSRIIDYQNLNEAWKRARKNKPARGADNVTWEMYEEDIKNNMKELNAELLNHSYRVTPVKKVTLFKEDKARDIVLYSMKDKVVQQSVAVVLEKLYNSDFSDCCYAYRPDKSALMAVEDITKAIQSGKYTWFVKADIEHFFDNINIPMLESILRSRIIEEDALQLILQDVTAPLLAENGDIVESRLGIHQGSALSPILSNIYLKDMDTAMAQAGGRYFRYSDDIVMLGAGEDQAKDLMNRLLGYIEKAGLRLNENKTLSGKIEDGFDFLGYHFDLSGKAIPGKAEASLADRLEGLWLTEKDLTAEEKLRKSTEIVQGWEQYFRGDRKPGSIYEYAAVFYMVQNKSPDGMEAFKTLRSEYHNMNLPLLKWMAAAWKAAGDSEHELFEYEDFYELTKLDQEKKIPGFYLTEAIGIYEKLAVNKDSESLLNLMQLYSDCSCYNKASVIEALAQQLEKNEKETSAAVHYSTSIETQAGQPQVLNADIKTLDKYMELFAGREDTYAEEEFYTNGGRKVNQVMEPLTPDVIKKHLNGQITAETYVERSNGTVKYCVLDIDVSKKILIELNGDAVKLQAYLQKAANAVRQYQKAIKTLGLSSYPEESGYRGFHLWIFFTDWIPARFANMLENIIDSRVTLSDSDITVEFFPNTARLKPGKFGPTIKLPYGIHSKTGKRSRMLDSEFAPIDDPRDFVGSAAKFSLNNIKQILSAEEGAAERRKSAGTGERANINGGVGGVNAGGGNNGENCGTNIRSDSAGNCGANNGSNAGSNNGDNSNHKVGAAGVAAGNIGNIGQAVDTDLSVFGDISDNVRIVLERCNLMRYLCQKAAKTRYLSHFERLTVLYVFGHMGEEGKEFVHKIMSFTVNYQYHITEKFISRLKEKPIGCNKLREEYAKITAEIGCSCTFHRTRNCYPSPVLHALKDSSNEEADGITIPISRTLTKENVQNVYQELNISQQVKEIAKKVLDLKKQKRGIDKNIEKYEKELEHIYDEAHVESLECDIGLLIRRKKDGGGYEWVIEI